jgi:hypothetical protein
VAAREAREEPRLFTALFIIRASHAQVDEDVSVQAASEAAQTKNSVVAIPHHIHCVLSIHDHQDASRTSWREQVDGVKRISCEDRPNTTER